jgi:branched-chain amino acid transport system substrate-binding protein
MASRSLASRASEPVYSIFKKHSNGPDLSDVPARAFTGFMALLDALNRAGSTDPEKLRAALAVTNIPADQLIVPYRGVKFDATGQNEPVRPILMQVQKGKYCTIYPFELTSCPVLFPTPTWAEKAKM